MQGKVKEKEEYLQENSEIFPKNRVNGFENYNSEKFKKSQSNFTVLSKIIQNKGDNKDILDFSERNRVQIVFHSQIFKCHNY